MPLRREEEQTTRARRQAFWYFSFHLFLFFYFFLLPSFFLHAIVFFLSISGSRTSSYKLLVLSAHRKFVSSRRRNKHISVTYNCTCIVGHKFPINLLNSATNSLSGSWLLHLVWQCDSFRVVCNLQRRHSFVLVFEHFFWFALEHLATFVNNVKCFSVTS